MLLTELPSELASMHQHVKVLRLGNNALCSLPREIALMTKLEELWLHKNKLQSLPAELGRLTNLKELSLGFNALRSLPRELGQLKSLTWLEVRRRSRFEASLIRCFPTARLQSAQVAPCRARPAEETHNALRKFRAHHKSLLTSGQIHANLLPEIAGAHFDFSAASSRQCVLRLDDILAATTHIGMIRERATEICVGLQDLELPAFVTLQIVDETVHENSIRMWAKWELITTVKHFHSKKRNPADD